MNVLLTSVGRRAYMVKYFKAALGKGTVHVCNSDSLSVAFQYADKAVISPLIYSNDYIPFLLNYCQDNAIDIVVPLFDIDAYVLAKNKDRFEKSGTKVIVSSPEIVAMCNDKWKTYTYLTEHGFNAPETFLKMENVKKALAEKTLNFPIVVKPRFGCGSISISIAYDINDLEYLYKKTIRQIENSYLKYESDLAEDKVIFQEFLNGQEFGADIINDLTGKTKNVIIRKKLAMRSGETDIAELIDAPEIKSVLIKLGKVTKHIANMDCDVFVADGKIYVLELNARFGGGYPFSHMGGCNLPKAIVKWVSGKVVNKQILQSETGITGFKEILITKSTKTN